MCKVSPQNYGLFIYRAIVTLLSFYESERRSSGCVRKGDGKVLIRAIEGRGAVGRGGGAAGRFARALAGGGLGGGCRRGGAVGVDGGTVGGRCGGAIGGGGGHRGQFGGHGSSRGAVAPPYGAQDERQYDC